jgi:hypothetical protein
MQVGAAASLGLALLFCAVAACGETRGTLVTTGDGWRPALATSWQIQLTGPLDSVVDASIYVVDLFDTTETQIAALRGAGRRVLCYVSVGTLESWRSDAADFPTEAVGMANANYPDERWLDIRHPIVRTRMTARMDAAGQKGCDGVELSSVSSGGQNTGFPLTSSDVLDYAGLLTSQSRRLGLSPGIGGGEDRAATLEPEFDWAFTQGCLEAAHCGALAPFVAAQKVVFAVEFGTEADLPSICPLAQAAGVNALIKNRSLDAFRAPCQ